MSNESRTSAALRACVLAHVFVAVLAPVVGPCGCEWSRALQISCLSLVCCSSWPPLSSGRISVVY